MTQTIELKTLISYLDAQRGHVLGILEGLDEDHLRKAVLPSGWTCRELLHHLALDDEAFWFRGTVAGDQEVIDAVAANQDGWKVPEAMSGADVIALYRREMERSDAVIAATAIDAAPAWWPEELFGEWKLESLREILLHVIVETAAHAGIWTRRGSSSMAGSGWSSTAEQRRARIVWHGGSYGHLHGHGAEKGRYGTSLPAACPSNGTLPRPAATSRTGPAMDIPFPSWTVNDGRHQ